MPQRAAGCALSALYPATVTLYRRCGYELAGGRYAIRLKPRDIGLLRRDCDVAPIGETDAATVEQLYSAGAAQRNGYLDRNPFMWKRVREPLQAQPRGFAFLSDGVPEGYVYYVQRSPSTHDQQLDVLDLVVRSPRAAVGALSFFADHRSLVNEIVWRSGPADPLLMLLPERHYRVELDIYWMLRIVHLPNAFEARGYPAGLTADLHLDVTDDLFDENSGRWIVSISDGRASVRKGGEGRIRCDIRALAALYAGFQSAEALNMTGALACTADDAATANAAFLGLPPSMADIF